MCNISAQLCMRKQPRIRKKAFFKINNISYLKKQSNSEESNRILWKYVKNKVKLAWHTFLNFAQISSYLIFKVFFLEKRMCNSFWTRIDADVIDRILETFYNILPRKGKFQPFNVVYDFWILNFELKFEFFHYFNLRCYCVTI